MYIPRFVNVYKLVFVLVVINTVNTHFAGSNNTEIVISIKYTASLILFEKTACIARRVTRMVCLLSPPPFSNRFGKYKFITFLFYGFTVTHDILYVQLNTQGYSPVFLTDRIFCVPILTEAKRRKNKQSRLCKVTSTQFLVIPLHALFYF